jgi:hypothetical protein
MPCGSYWLEISDRGGSMDVGITRCLFDKEIFGDVDKSVISSTSLSLHWSGLKISDADELYHTVWQNVEGVKEIDLKQLPNVSSDCRVEMNPRRPTYESCEEDWLLRISADTIKPDSLENAEHLITEEQYRVLSSS